MHCIILPTDPPVQSWQNLKRPSNTGQSTSILTLNTQAQDKDKMVANETEFYRDDHDNDKEGDATKNTVPSAPRNMDVE